MSLSHLRDAITRHLQEAADGKTNAAVNMRATTTMTADQYALIQVDHLAQARAYLDAINIVTKEYKRLTEAPVTEGNVSPMIKQKKEESVYG